MTKGKTALPEDFQLTEDMKSWARINAGNIDAHQTTQEFIDYSRGRDWRMADWVATWRNWMRKASREAKGRSRFAGAEKVADAKPRVWVEENYPQGNKWRAAANRILFAVLQAATPVPADLLPKLVHRKNVIGDRLGELYGNGECNQNDWRTHSKQAFDWLMELARGTARPTGARTGGEGEGESSALAA